MSADVRGGGAVVGTKRAFYPPFLLFLLFLLVLAFLSFSASDG